MSDKLPLKRNLIGRIMKNKRFELNRLFYFIVIYFIFLLVTSWVMSFIWFNAWVNLAIATAATVFAWLPVRRRLGSPGGMFEGADRKALLVLVIILLVFSALTFLFFHDTFSGYRDEGVYASSAVHLSENGDLGDLNERGVKNRYFLNVAFSAQLYGLFGFSGMKLANIIAAVIGLTGIFLLVYSLSKKEWAGVMAVAITCACYPVLWFARRTVNEIVFFGLFWTAAYFIYRCFTLEKPAIADYAIALVAFSLLGFARLEGLAALGVAVLAALYLLARERKTEKGRLTLRTGVLYLLILIMLVSFITGAAVAYEHYHGTGKLVRSNINILTGGGDIPAGSLDAHQPAYVALAMIKFGIFPALLMLVPFFFLLLKGRKTREFGVFLLLLALPFAYFLVRPNISFDLPCLLKRFVAVIIPLSIVALACVAFRLSRAGAVAVTSAFLLLAVFISAPVIFHGEYHRMIVNVGKVAASVPEGERIVVDGTMLDYYGIQYPLQAIYGREAIRGNLYVEIDKAAEEGTKRVYVVTNQANLELFRRHRREVSVDFVASMAFEYSYLRPTCEFFKGIGTRRSAMLIDYRVALSRIEVPGDFVDEAWDIVISRVDIPQ